MSKESALAMMNPAPTESVATPETPQTATQEAPKSLDSERFAALARKEAEFVKKQQAWQKEREDILAQKAKADEILKKGQLYDETFKKNKIEALKLLGYSETDIFNILADLQPKEQTPEEKAALAAEQAAAAKIKEFEEAQAKKLKEDEERRDSSLIQSFKSDMSKIIETNKEKYEYCAYYGESAVDLAYRTVLQIVQDSNGEDVPSAQEAIEMIEELYEEQDKAMSAIKKRQPKTETPAEAAAPAQERSRVVTTPPGSTPPKPVITKTRTLSNAGTATVAGALSRAAETKDQKRARLEEVLRSGNTALLRH